MPQMAQFVPAQVFQQGGWQQQGAPVQADAAFWSVGSKVCGGAACLRWPLHRRAGKKAAHTGRNLIKNSATTGFLPVATLLCGVLRVQARTASPAAPLVAHADPSKCKASAGGQVVQIGRQQQGGLVAGPLAQGLGAQRYVVHFAKQAQQASALNQQHAARTARDLQGVALP